MSGTTCVGEYFLKTNSSIYVTAPMNSEYASYNLSEITIEVWFKMDNITTTTIEIILGTSPYKIRRRLGTTQIELNYNANVNYCVTSALTVDTWYHFAFTIEETYQSFYCYLNGVSYSTGSGTALITAEVFMPTEITFGGTTNVKSNETPFNGYIKEFRMWN